MVSATIRTGKPTAMPSAVLALVLASCVADPWPEPDSARHEDSPPDIDYGDSDGGSPGDDKDQESPTEDSDHGESGKDTEAGQTAGDLMPDRVFIDTPADGIVTVVGLPGAVTAAGTLLVMGDDAVRVARIGREGGFVERIDTARFGARLELVFIDREDSASRLVLSAGSAEGATPDSLIGDGEGAARLSDSLSLVHGKGAHLPQGGFAVVGNLDGAVGAIAPVVCGSDTCEFSLVIPAKPGDQIAVFLLRDDSATFGDSLGVGTISEIIVVE